MKQYIRQKLIESLSNTPNEVSIYNDNINKIYNDLQIRLSNQPNYVSILGGEMNYNVCGNKHMCDVNTYSFIKGKLNDGETNYYPVAGFWYFKNGKGWDMFEHRWVYNKNDNSFIEPSPITGEKPSYYIGLINFELNDDIKNSNNVKEIGWFSRQITKSFVS